MLVSPGHLDKRVAMVGGGKNDVRTERAVTNQDKRGSVTLVGQVTDYVHQLWRY